MASFGLNNNRIASTLSEGEQLANCRDAATVRSCCQDTAKLLAVTMDGFVLDEFNIVLQCVALAILGPTWECANINIRESRILNSTPADLSNCVQLWSDLVCYESIGAPYDSKSKYTNEDLFHVLQPLSEFVWKERFAPEAGRMLGGVLLHEWLQVLQKDVEKWSDCKEHDCAGTPHIVSVSFCKLIVGKIVSRPSNKSI